MVIFGISGVCISIPAVDIVDVSVPVVVYAVARYLAGVGPHIGGKIRMLPVDAGVDNTDNHVIRAGRVVPSSKSTNIDSGCLRIVHPPKRVKEQVIRLVSKLQLVVGLQEVKYPDFYQPPGVVFVYRSSFENSHFRLNQIKRTSGNGLAAEPDDYRLLELVLIVAARSRCQSAQTPGPAVFKSNDVTIALGDRAGREHEVKQHSSCKKAGENRMKKRAGLALYVGHLHLANEQSVKQFTASNLRAIPTAGQN